MSPDHLRRDLRRIPDLTSARRPQVAMCPAKGIQKAGRRAAECPFLRRLDPDAGAVLPPFLGGAAACPAALLPRSDLESCLTRCGCIYIYI